MFLAVASNSHSFSIIKLGEDARSVGLAVLIGVVSNGKLQQTVSQPNRNFIVFQKKQWSLACSELHSSHLQRVWLSLS